MRRGVREERAYVRRAREGARRGARARDDAKARGRWGGAWGGARRLVSCCDGAPGAAVATRARSQSQR